jgi:hypothetical protein
MPRDSVKRRKVGYHANGWCELIRIGYKDGTVSWAVQDPRGGLAIFNSDVGHAKTYIRALVREFPPVQVAKKISGEFS